MKKTLLIAALTMVAAPAFASKARLAALQNAAHLVDVQNTFEQPWQAGVNGELATVEFGTAGGTPNAEGGFVRQMNDSYLGVYLGHQPKALVDAAGQITITNAGGTVTSRDAFALNNPLNVWYAAKAGDITWGVNFFYLNSNQGSKDFDVGAGTALLKDRKSNVMGVSAGATNGTWDASVVLGLAGKSEFTTGDANTTVTAALPTDTKVEINSKSNMKLMGGWKADSLYYYGSYTATKGTVAVAGTDRAENETSNITVGVINSHKKDGTDFFYGIAYGMDTTKQNIAPDSKTEKTLVPVIVGVEAEANSWMTLRGSLSQSFPILATSKTTNNGTAGDASTPDNDTTVAAGAALKFNKFTVDTFIAASKNGDVTFDSTKFLTQASLTYMF